MPLTPFTGFKMMNAMNGIVSSDRHIIMNALDPSKGSSNLTSALMYYNAITDYMSQLRDCLGELRDDIE